MIKLKYLLIEKDFLILSFNHFLGVILLMRQKTNLSGIPITAIKRIKGEIADVFEITFKGKSKTLGIVKMLNTLKHLVNSDWWSYEIFYGKSFET